jgi:hypothetical protein
MALAGAEVVPADVATGVVVAVVDALVVRGVAWIEPSAVDLDVARLREAVGSSRPELRAVVAVGDTVSSVAVWDDRTEARTVADDGTPGPTIVLDALGPDEDRLELRDGVGRTVVVDLGRGVAGSAVECVDADPTTYLERLAAWAEGEARRGADDLDHLNRLRRELVVASDALEAGAAEIERFDAVVAALAAGSASVPELVDVVALARRVGDGRWLLAVERWSDHWRLEVAGRWGRGRWTATSDGDIRHGGAPVGDGLVRFDPPLAPGWSSLRITCGEQTVAVRR